MGVSKPSQTYSIVAFRNEVHNFFTQVNLKIRICSAQKFPMSYNTVAYKLTGLNKQ